MHNRSFEEKVEHLNWIGDDEVLKLASDNADLISERTIESIREQLITAALEGRLWPGYSTEEDY